MDVHTCCSSGILYCGTMNQYNEKLPLLPMPAVAMIPTQLTPTNSCLLIPSVLNEILSYSSYEDLKRHRSVSKQWNEEASKHLRKKIFVDFDQNRRIISYHHEMEEKKDFCDHFRIRVQGLSPPLEEFLQDFGPFIRKLDITHQIGLPRSELLCILYSYLPNLEELSLGIIELFKLTHGLFPDRQEGEIIPALLKLKKLQLNFDMMEEGEPRLLIRDLIHIMPNLEEISIPELNFTKLNIQDIVYISQQHMQAGKEDCIEDFLEILEPHPKWLSDILETFLNDVNIPMGNLKRINIPLRLKDTQIRKLEQKRLPLENLNLELNSNVKSACVEKLLCSLGKTLKCLKIKYFHAIKSKCSNHLTRGNEFDRLQSVHLHSFQGSLKFLENIPALKNLTLSSIILSRSVLQQDLNVHNKPHYSLRTFKVYDDLSSQCSHLAVQNLTTYLPNLTVLRLEKLTDKGLRHVFSNCAALEELHILRGLYTDEGITGIHPNAYRVIHREQSYDHINPNVFRNGPHIGHLKKLRKLEIASPEITDVSIILGLMYCSELRHLYVSSYGITDNSLLRLVDKMNLVSLKTEWCNQLTVSAVEYAKEKLEGREVSLNEYKGPMDRKKIPGFIRETRYLKVSLPDLKPKNV